MYYYDADGHMYQNAGAQIDGYWYYFDANGVMKKEISGERRMAYSTIMMQMDT